MGLFALFDFYHVELIHHGTKVLAGRSATNNLVGSHADTKNNPTQFRKYRRQVVRFRLGCNVHSQIMIIVFNFASEMAAKRSYGYVNRSFRQH